MAQTLAHFFGLMELFAKANELKINMHASIRENNFVFMLSSPFQHADFEISESKRKYNLALAKSRIAAHN